MDTERPGGMEFAVEDDRLVTIPAEHVAKVRQVQLEALRTELGHLRAELAGIVAGTSRLALTEAVVVLETTENSIRRHFLPVLIAAGAIGYLWGISRQAR